MLCLLFDYLLIRIRKTLESLPHRSKLRLKRRDLEMVFRQFNLDFSLANFLAVGGSDFRFGVTDVRSDLVEALLDRELDKPFELLDPYADAAQLFLAVCLHREGIADLLLGGLDKIRIPDLEKNLLRF